VAHRFAALLLARFAGSLFAAAVAAAAKLALEAANDAAQAALFFAARLAAGFAARNATFSLATLGLAVAARGTASGHLGLAQTRNAGFAAARFTRCDAATLLARTAVMQLIGSPVSTRPRGQTERCDDSATESDPVHCS
jgi:hypothetical protein